MTLKRLVLVKLFHIGIAVVFLVPSLFNGRAGDLSPTDEHPPFGTLKENSVFAATVDNHLHTTGKLALDRKVLGCVIGIEDGRISVLKRHRMFGI